jgi:hypothetical protein
MSLKEVRIGEEVWLTCLSHALTTETEEVMGLLLGDVEVTPKLSSQTPAPLANVSLRLLRSRCFPRTTCRPRAGAAPPR